MEITNLNKTELKKLLKNLNNYKDLKKKIGARGISLFKRKITSKPKLEVEYFHSTGEDLAYDISSGVYSKFFGITPKREEILFKSRDYLTGGIKVYFDDSMVDLSFSKVERLLRS